MNKVMLNKIEEIVTDKELDDDMKMFFISSIVKAFAKSNRKQIKKAK